LGERGQQRDLSFAVLARFMGVEGEYAGELVLMGDGETEKRDTSLALGMFRVPKTWIVAHVGDHQGATRGGDLANQALADCDREVLLDFDGEADSDPAPEQMGRFIEEKQAHGRDSRNRGGLRCDGLEALSEVEGGREHLARVEERLEFLWSKGSPWRRTVRSAVCRCLVHLVSVGQAVATGDWRSGAQRGIAGVEDRFRRAKLAY